MRDIASLNCPARICASLATPDALARLESSPGGLPATEAKKRHAHFGDNRLPRAKRPGIFSRVYGQLKSPLILILLVVAAVVPFTGHASDAVVIFIVLTFNTVVGLVQEGRASRALDALEKVFVATCTVRRDGVLASIAAHELTVGDIVVLKEGDRIPADGRIIEASGLRVDESMLTGESTPVTKTSDALPSLGEHAPLGDIRNAALGQTLVVAGSGTMVVSSVGADTEVGRIALALAGAQTEAPLAAKVRRLSHAIAGVVAALTAVLFVIGILAGRPALTLFATVLSLAVSVVPEGLPIVLTLVLARGVTHMARRNAVVKKLNAVEGLGQVQVICTDKTGTLTQNKLVVQRAYDGVRTVDVAGEGFSPDGRVSHGTRGVRHGAHPELDRLALAARLFGGDSLRQDEEGAWHPSGDPVDAALLAFSRRYGTNADAWKLVEERPFSYAERRRSGRWTKDGETVSFMAGSPENVLALCAGDGIKEAHKMISTLATEGLRVIAVAARDGNLPLDAKDPWTFAGLVGMGDALRPRVAENVRWCLDQGIRVVMVTGDHPETALAIAKRAGITDDPSSVMNGPDFERLSDAELASVIDRVRVFSRISPAHKVRIVEAFRARGFLTAMTGDGVNDAPALHRADIGVAMGKGGTDVAREAADLVLLDDNFATIVAAIQEGRATVSNVRRVIMYLFSTSVAEAGIITATLLLNLPLPLLPGQIIWINLVTDSFLDVSLGLEPRHGTIHVHGGALIDRRSVLRMLLLGSTMTVGTFILYLGALHRTEVYLQTLTLTTLAAYQWMNAWNARSETRSLARLSPVSNPYLLVATFVVVSLQLLAVYAPPFQRLLRTEALPATDWAVILAVASTVILVDELWKKVRHKPSGQTAVLP